MSLALYILLIVILAIPVACAMEPWARILHGRVWHAALWSIHRTHHEPRRGRFETNDALSSIHAPVAAAMIIVGCQLPRALPSAILVGVGSGMTLFGFSYLLVHDGLVHGRLGRRVTTMLGRSPWLRAIRRAHVVHHTLGGVPYGLFQGPREMAKHGAKLTNGARARGESPNAPSASDRARAAPDGTRPPGCDAPFA